MTVRVMCATRTDRSLSRQTGVTPTSQNVVAAPSTAAARRGCVLVFPIKFSRSVRSFVRGRVARRGEDLVLLIARSRLRSTPVFHDLANRKLDAARGHLTVKELPAKRAIMVHPQDGQRITLVEAILREQALALGPEIACALIRSAASTSALGSVGDFMATGVRIGPGARAADAASPRDPRNTARTASGGSSRGKIVSQALSARRVARTLQAALCQSGFPRATDEVQPGVGGRPTRPVPFLASIDGVPAQIGRPRAGK